METETLREAILYFRDRDIARQFVADLRWPNGVTCPHCDADAPMFLASRKIWKCRDCRKQFSVKVGTIFEDSPLGLEKWLPALWMLANCKNGISSYELARDLGVTQKTAWFMLSRIRLAMQTKSFKKLKGTVEADESFIGGKAGNMHHKKRQRGIGQTNMVGVMGLLERKRGRNHSTVRLDVIPTTKAKELEKRIRANVEPGSEVFTDAFPSYRSLARKAFGDDYNHAAIDHAISYGDGAVHTNGLENFWSLLKRSIKGTYISVDPFHLFRYLDEQAYRFNHREVKDLDRFVGVVRAIVNKRLTYSDLISADMVPTTT
jgi:transposase-like protein